MAITCLSTQREANQPFFSEKERDEYWEQYRKLHEEDEE